jgi:diguanylate cyclase (GGDEF)-like protein
MDKRFIDTLAHSNTRTNRFFKYLSQKVCFTFAVSFFSISGAAAAVVPALVFISATVPYKNIDGFKRDIAVCLIWVIFFASVHYLLYGVGRLWGKKWELRDLRILNDHVQGSRISADIPMATLREISSLLERLPGKNFRTALFLGVPTVIIAVGQSYIFSGEILNAFYAMQGGAIALTTYIIFTYLITELVTANLRRETRLFLADCGVWEGVQHSTTLMIKFLFIIILMFTSTIITHGISTSTVISSPFQAVIIFSVLNLVVGVFMCILVFISILITLREIEATAIQLSDGQQARFISGSIDREFIDTSMGLYHAGQKIVKYRNDLQQLNLNLEQRVRDRTEQIEIMSRTDALTSCFNRGYLIENLPQEIKKALRYNRPFSLIICDLDHFKMVNDTYGHQAGDQVLKEFVQCITEAYRSEVDWVVRYGGEEFVIALPETDIDGARALAERIRETIADRNIVFGSKEIHITVSCGVTGFDSGTTPEQICVENLIREADRCLYRAKEEGRNRVVAGRL